MTSASMKEILRNTSNDHLLSNEAKYHRHNVDAQLVQIFLDSYLTSIL